MFLLLLLLLLLLLFYFNPTNLVNTKTAIPSPPIKRLKQTLI